MGFFDWQYYLDKYPDLRVNGVNNEQKALQHWFNHGEKEGRVSIRTPDFFDWQYYLDKYPDLRVNGVNNEQKALQHWFNHGVKEGRTSHGTKCGFAISTYHKNNSRFESFKICISSIMKNKKEDTIVIIVDDGSIVTNHIVWVSITFPEIKIIEKRVNSGISKCKNTCLRALYESACDVFFLLDDDIEFLQPIEDKYICSLYDENVGILSAGWFDNVVLSNYSKNTNITKCLNGYLLCFTKYSFEKSGFFKIFPSKWSYEHAWYTIRIMKCTGQSNYLDTTNSELYTRLIDVISTIDEDEKQIYIKKNGEVLCTAIYDYQHCIE